MKNISEQQFTAYYLVLFPLQGSLLSKDELCHDQYPNCTVIHLSRLASLAGEDQFLLKLGHCSCPPDREREGGGGVFSPSNLQLKVSLPYTQLANIVKHFKTI